MAKVLSMETAARIWNAHREIIAAEKLRTEMRERLSRMEDPNPRDAWGKRRNLSLGVPSGENATTLFDVDPKLAVHIIDAHVENKKKELIDASIAARVELGEIETTTCP